MVNRRQETGDREKRRLIMAESERENIEPSYFGLGEENKKS